MIKPHRLVPLLLLFLSPLAMAFGQPYDAARFDALMKDGKPVLVHIHADWCSTCRAQDALLQDLLGQTAYRDITPLQVDFDAQKAAVRGFRASMQSTLVLFKGGKEVDRVVAETRRPRLAALLDKAR